MNRLPFLSQRLFNVPLAIHPRKAEIVIGALAERLGIVSFTRMSGERVPMSAWYDDDDDEWTRPARYDPGYDLVKGVAVIPIRGMLVHRLGQIRPYSGMSGYDAVREAFLIAMDDPAVRGVAFEIDSPGGEVAGCFDLADEVFRWRGVKPIAAILSESAYSAAYAIASAADRIWMPRSGGVGSIGIMCCHVDFSRAISNAGLEVTFIQYGAHKTEGVSEKPLAPDARERFQADVDEMGELFVATVARNRGLSADVIRGTEAMTYQGAAGVAIGLADALLPPNLAFEEFAASLA